MPWMDLEGITLSEINQTKTNTMLSHLYEESKERKEQTKQKQTQIQRSICQRGGGPGGGVLGEKGQGMEKCK